MENATSTGIMKVFGMDINVEEMKHSVLKNVLLHLKKSEEMRCRKDGGEYEASHRDRHHDHRDCTCIPFMGGL